MKCNGSIRDKDIQVKQGGGGERQGNVLEVAAQELSQPLHHHDGKSR